MDLKRSDHYFIMEEIEGELTLYCWIDTGRKDAYDYLFGLIAEQPSRTMMVWDGEKYRNWVELAFGEGIYGTGT